MIERAMNGTSINAQSISEKPNIKSGILVVLEIYFCPPPLLLPFLFSSILNDFL